MKTQVLVVDNDRMTSRLLVHLLGSAGYAVTPIHDPREVAAFLECHTIELILLDIVLHNMDGLTLCKLLRREHPEVPIIFLSTRASSRDKIEAFTCGADDFIAKPFEPNELLARMGAVLRRYHWSERHESHAALVRAGNAVLDIGRLEFTPPERMPVLLTPTEMRLLEHLMRNANTIVPREVLAERVGGYDQISASNRVDVCIRRLRRKIEANPDCPTFIHTVRGIGYVFRVIGGAPTVAVG